MEESKNLSDLSQEVLAALTTDDKQELEIWTELLESRGYRQLLLFLEGNFNSVKAVIENANSWDEYLYSRGGRDALNLVLNLETILATRMELVAEAKIEAEEVETTFADEIDEISVNLGLEA